MPQVSLVLARELASPTSGMLMAMSGEWVLLVAVTVALAIRALWASAVLHRHIGWVVAGSFAGGLAAAEKLGSHWPLLVCIVVFGVGEFWYQVGSGPPPWKPPAKWLTPI